MLALAPMRRESGSGWQTIPEVREPFNKAEARGCPRIDSTFFRQGHDGKIYLFVVEWGLKHDTLVHVRQDDTLVTSFAKEKVDQVKDRLYVDRALQWLHRNGYSTPDTNVIAVAAVVCVVKTHAGVVAQQSKALEVTFGEIMNCCGCRLVVASPNTDVCAGDS